ncbi:hypothetical protein KJ940_01130, partial [Myxococcota bacterium]|nr:hypothetical protein [Myxococcota bacterium]
MRLSWLITALALMASVACEDEAPRSALIIDAGRALDAALDQGLAVGDGEVDAPRLDSGAPDAAPDA